MQEALLILHVLGACIIFGMVVASTIVARQKDFSLTQLAVYAKLRFFGGMTVGIQMITGVLLAAFEPDNFLNNPVFWVKMVVFLIDGIIAGGIIRRRIMQVQEKNDEQALRNSKLPMLSVLNLISMIIVVTLGVVIAQ
jgi:uncharacterized membrane protein